MQLASLTFLCVFSSPLVGRLGMTSVDQVYPLTADVVNALNKIAQLPPEFAPKVKAKTWLQVSRTLKSTSIYNHIKIKRLKSGGTLNKIKFRPSSRQKSSRFQNWASGLPKPLTLLWV